MAGVGTVEKLQDKLAAQLGWRKKEIHVLRSAAARASASRDYYSRAGSVMLCAHWEGFLRSAVSYYVDHVFSQGLGISSLKPQFVAIYFFKHVRVAGEAAFPGSELHHVKLAKKITAALGEPLRRSSWEVNTNGNPSSTICSDLLRSVALDPQIGYDNARWSVTKVFIDSQVLAHRHKIAHGERISVSGEQFMSKSRRIVEICEDVFSLVVSAAAQRSYLKEE